MNDAIPFAMASSRKTTRAASVDGGYSPCQPGLLLRLITVVTAFTMAMPPLPLVAATWDAQETTTNPFVWPPPSVPLPAQVPGMFPAAESFPSFAIAPAVSPLLPQAPADLPWLPGDLDPIAPPDGMPVQGNPAGLALLENAVGNGIVVGEVSDATSLDPIPGALVELVGTGRTAEADAKGRFQFAGLPAGTFNIEASQLGYFTDTTVVTVIEGSPSEIRFGLRARPTDDTVDETTLEEETIVGEYQGDSGGDFNLELVMDSPNISAGLNKEDLSRTGASDAGAAVSKISGANIVGGRYAVVRGLGDRYSNTLFNGALIPSADPSKKAVQLDLFPSDLLESVAITKLFLPELPAEFAGGTVQIQTLRLPEKPIVEASVGTRWFTERPDGGFMGDPNSKISFDEIEYSLMPRGFDQEGGFTGSVIDAVALHSSAPMRPSKVDDEQALDYSVVLGNTFNPIEGVKIGGVFALTRDTRNTYEDATLGRGFRGDNPSTPGRDPFIANSRRSEKFTRELTFGLMSGVTLELGDKHEIGFTYFTNEAFGDGYVRTTNSRNAGVDPLFVANPNGEKDPVTGELVRALARPVGASDFFEPLQRSLDITQYDGTHLLYGEKGRGGTFKWMVSQATAIEERPHSRTYNYTPLDFTDAEFLLPFAASDPSLFRPDFGVYEGAGDPVLANGFPEVSIFRETLKTEDQGENRRLDISLPAYFDEDTDDHVGIRFGYNTSERKREVRGRFLTYDFTRINDRLLLENSLGVYQGTYGNLFHQNFNSSFFPDNPAQPIFGGSGITINDFSGNGFTIRNIDAGTLIDSKYIGADFASNGWTIDGGARIETEERSYQILPNLNPSLIANSAPVVIKTDSVLPGVVLTKTMGNSDEILLTAGWSRTVARPTFYEFAPAFVVDQATGDVTRGNPNLKNSSITNFDLRFDYKADEISNLGIGLFSKTIVDPIVDAFDPVLNAQSWINGDMGTLNGLELEANTLLADHYRIGGNYTFINSDLQYSIRGRQLNTGFTGQPEHIFNLFAGYENEDIGISANFIYNYTGSYMSAAPTSASAPSIMEEAYESLDFILQKSFTAWDCDGKVTIGVRNILDSTRRQFFSPGDFTFREGKPGRSLSLSCGINF